MLQFEPIAAYLLSPVSSITTSMATGGSVIASTAATGSPR